MRGASALITESTDGLHEAVGEWGVLMEEPVVDGAVQEVERDLDVGAGCDLTAFDRSYEEHACGIAARVDEVLQVELRELRIGLRLGDQARDHAAERLLVQLSQPGA